MLAARGQGISQLLRSSRRAAARRESLPFEGEQIIDNIRRLAATILCCAAIAAQAQSVEETAPTHWKFGVQLGTVQDHDKTEPVGQVSLGYAIDRTWSVEALADISLIFMRDGGLKQGDREFDSAVGGRVLATLPLGDRWSLVGGLGLVQFRDETGTGTLSDSVKHSKTSPMVSLAAMFRLGRRWSLGVETSSFTQAHTFNAGLRSEFHF